jgi:putative redox protein
MSCVAKPPTTVELVWEHDLVLAGPCGSGQFTLDSASVEGPSPVQAVAFALAGCMAMDVVHILKKGRHDLRGLKVELTAHRAESDPRRVTAVEMKYAITGNVPKDQVQRAIDLSRDKYCSVWHSMREDITLEATFSVASGV